MRLLNAILIYFALVFGAGFILGPIRTFWLEPRVGAFTANLIEAPFLICAMVIAARFVVQRFQIVDWLGRSLVGLGAVALVIGADFTVGLALRGLTAAAQWDYLSSAAGRIYLGLLAAFAVAPLLIGRAAASSTISDA